MYYILANLHHSLRIFHRFGGWSSASLTLNQTSTQSNNSVYQYYNGTRDNFVVWFNNKGYHALPAYTNALHNAMLREIAAKAAPAAEMRQQSKPIASRSNRKSATPSQFGISTWVQAIKIRGHQIWDQSV